MNISHRSPRGSTIRIAQGPSPDGVWKKRQKLSDASDWRAEMKAHIEKKRTVVSNLFQEAVEASANAARSAAAVLASLNPCPLGSPDPVAVVSPFVSPYPFPFPFPVPYYAYASAPAPYEEIFTAEEIESEQTWVDPLVSFSDESYASYASY